MKPSHQPPPLATPNGAPPLPKRRRIGWFTKFGTLIIALLLLAQLWPQLQNVNGRRELWTKTADLLRSADTYILAGVLLVNSLLYSLIVRHFYPTGHKTTQGLARAVMLLKRDSDADSEGDEIKHFFLIFILPLICFGAGTAEYQLLMAWLHGR